MRLILLSFRGSTPWKCSGWAVGVAIRFEPWTRRVDAKRVQVSRAANEAVITEEPNKVGRTKGSTTRPSQFDFDILLAVERYKAAYERRTGEGCLTRQACAELDEMGGLWWIVAYNPDIDPKAHLINQKQPVVAVVERRRRGRPRKTAKNPHPLAKNQRAHLKKYLNGVGIAPDRNGSIWLSYRYQGFDSLTQAHSAAWGRIKRDPEALVVYENRLRDTRGQNRPATDWSGPWRPPFLVNASGAA